MDEKVINQNPKRKKSPLKITLIIVLAIVLILITAAAASIGILTNKMNKVKTTRDDLGITPEIEKEINEIKNTPSKENKEGAANDKIINIALFGIDAGSNDSGRSDSIMILTVDPVHNKMKVASIMRDSYVEIPGYGKDKINHAFAFGGSTLALNTINTNFGLAIDKFVATNFTDMPLIIDKLGGIDLNVTDEELPHLQALGVSNTGIQTLNGEQSLAYSRIRYATGDDFERTSRHRTILGAIYRKLMTVPMSQYPSLLLDFLPLVETNMSSTDLLALGTTINKINGSELIEDRFPRDGFWQNAEIGGIYYLSFEVEPTKRQLQRFIYEN